MRAIAHDLYETIQELPLICPHGHVDPRRLSSDEPFDDPASLLVTSDHYVTRLLHASGIPLEELGVGGEPLSEESARRIWRLLCANWDVYRGTAVRYWFENQLVELFGVTSHPSLQTADAIYDQILACLGEDAFRPRRSTPASASRCSRRPTTRATTSLPTGRSPTTRPGREG